MSFEIEDTSRATFANTVIPVVCLSVAAMTACQQGVSVYQDGSLVPIELDLGHCTPSDCTLGGVSVDVIPQASAELFSAAALALEGDGFA